MVLVVDNNICQKASAHLISTIQNMRIGKLLRSQEIERVVNDYLAGKTANYQMSAWLATIASLGMHIDEIESLTKAYVFSGKQQCFSDLGYKVVDKHSTGGVGDKVSLITAPIVAACGYKVVKLSGRGLGHAGGTIDKLESITGLRLNLNIKEMRTVLDKAGMVITSQSSELAPGDKSTYKLRDATGSVENIPLIAASIISKKISIKPDGLVLDVKTGEGALIQAKENASKLTRTMVELANRFGIKCKAILSDMTQPLGYAIGNALEVKEALSILQGKNVPRLKYLSCLLARLMIQVMDPSLSDTVAEAKVNQAISSGAAYNCFLLWAKTQGANISESNRLNFLSTTAHCKKIIAQRSGWIKTIKPRNIGNAAIQIYAGRLLQEISLDYASGIILQCQIGDKVNAGDCLAEIHYNYGDIDTATTLIQSAFIIDDSQPPLCPIVYQTYESS